MNAKLSKEEFIAGYCKRSGVSWDELSKSTVALPCACGDGACQGWAMVPNHPLCIATHDDLYAPLLDEDEQP